MMQFSMFFFGALDFYKRYTKDCSCYMFPKLSSKSDLLPLFAYFFFCWLAISTYLEIFCELILYPHSLLEVLSL